jgi:hypothetical protein
MGGAFSTHERNERMHIIFVGVPEVRKPHEEIGTVKKFQET